MRVRSELARVAADAGLPMVCPPLRLCMDNGVMVAWTGMQRLRLGLGERPLRVGASSEMLEMFVEVRPRWPIGPRDARSTTQQQQLAKRKRPPSLTATAAAAVAPKLPAAAGKPAGGGDEGGGGEVDAAVDANVKQRRQ